MSRRPIVLVGLPGAGKSAAGLAAAEALGAACLDIDRLLVGRTGRSIDRIFAELGEPAFRRLEAEAVAAALAGPPAIVVPGGGWAAQPGALEAARAGGAAGAYIIYICVAPETAAARVEAGEVRPLLAAAGGGADPASRMRDLLATRERFYRRADAAISGESAGPTAVAAEVVALARRECGW